jgi:hypothetical protein
VRHNERVLHLADHATGDTVDEIGCAMRMLTARAADYRQVRFTLDIPAAGNVVTGPAWYAPDAEALEAAAAIRPTFVFMHPQVPSVITPEVVEELRALCDPSCMIVQWTGDQHFEPTDAEQLWFVELGRVCDASLVVNTKHPVEYAALGVRHPGFLEVGIDEALWRPTPPTPNTPPIVCLANEYGQFDYTARNHAFAAAAAAFPGQFAVYGGGWEEQTAIPWRPYLQNADVPGIYSAARAALSISIRADLPRYTSNRLFYALGCGAIVLAERFPDCEGLGLRDGHNCFLWRGEDELRHCLATALGLATPTRRAMRIAARAVGLAHSWSARMGELQCIIDTVRSDR